MYVVSAEYILIKTCRIVRNIIIIIVIIVTIFYHIFLATSSGQATDDDIIIMIVFSVLGQTQTIFCTEG